MQGLLGTFGPQRGGQLQQPLQRMPGIRVPPHIAAERLQFLRGRLNNLAQLVDGPCKDRDVGRVPKGQAQIRVPAKAGGGWSVNQLDLGLVPGKNQALPKRLVVLGYEQLVELLRTTRCRCSQVAGRIQLGPGQCQLRRHRHTIHRRLPQGDTDVERQLVGLGKTRNGLEIGFLGVLGQRDPIEQRTGVALE